MPKPQADPDDDPRDDTDEGSGGPFVVVVVAVIVSIFAVLGFIGGWLSSHPFPPPAGTTTCSTTCMGFLRLECPGNRLMGLCLGISVCESPTHACGVDPP